MHSRSIFCSSYFCFCATALLCAAKSYLRKRDASSSVCPGTGARCVSLHLLMCHDTPPWRSLEGVSKTLSLSILSLLGCTPPRPLGWKQCRSILCASRGQPCACCSRGGWCPTCDPRGHARPCQVPPATMRTFKECVLHPIAKLQCEQPNP